MNPVINMDNVILIGMPGSGKSTCGILTAKLLCKKFVDTDLIIQQHEGMKLQQIINTKGNTYFAACEQRYVCELKTDNSVIATGGSVVYSDAAMQHLRGLGKIIYLEISLQEMKRRISNLKTRGILLKDGYTLDDMYRERAALYERYADHTVHCGGSIEATAHAIVALVE